MVFFVSVGIIILITLAYVLRLMGDARRLRRKLRGKPIETGTAIWASRSF